MTAMVQQPHRVTSVVAGMRAGLGSVADVPLWSMDAAETVAALDEVTAAEAQLAELKARLLLRAEQADVPGQTGATSTANWYAAHTRTLRPVAHRTMLLAHGLDLRDHTRAALARGAVNTDQAQVIVSALADLPDDLDPDLVDEAERRLIDHATEFDAKTLKLLGRRLLEVVDPDAADAHEASLLEKEERDAASATRFVMWDDGHGRFHGRFTVDALTGAMLKKAVDAIAAPKHRASAQTEPGPLGERRPTPERLGRAFAELVQRYPVDSLPKAGGLSATVVVTMTLDALMGGLKAAQLDTGGVVSASLARRLACEAGLIPAVLGGRLRGPRPRPHPPLPLQGPAHRGDGRAARLLRRGLRLPTRHDPPPPPETLVPGRRHRPRRLDALPPPPRTGPRSRVHHEQAAHRQVHLRPEGLTHPSRNTPQQDDAS